MADEEIRLGSLEIEFPRWEISRGTDQRWHAALKSAEKPAIVHDDDLLGLREEIIRYLARTGEHWRDQEAALLLDPHRLQ